VRSTENIEKLVKNLDLDIDIHSRTDQAVLSEMLDAQKKSMKQQTAFVLPNIRRLIMKSAWIKLAAATVIVLVAGTVVALNIGQYFYMGRDEGGHHFISDDAESIVTMDDADVTDVDQTRNDLQQMKLLGEQGKRELVRVIEIRANGHLERRLFSYKYHLPDGRTREMGEAAPENPGQWTLTDAQHKEMGQLKKAGPGEDLGTYEEHVMGRIFEFKQQRYVLSDGTELIWSIGEPKSD
jgi:hypothetical protein